MNDFLDTLVARVNGHPNSVYPRPASRYESSPVSNELSPNQFEMSENDQSEVADSERFQADPLRDTSLENRKVFKAPEVSSLVVDSRIAGSENNASRDKQDRTEVDSLSIETLMSRPSLTTRDQTQILSPADNVPANPLSEMIIYPLVDNTDRIANLERRINELGQQQKYPTSGAFPLTDGTLQENADYSHSTLPLTPDKLNQKFIESQSTNEHLTWPVQPNILIEQVAHNATMIQNNIQHPVIKVTIGRIDVRAIVNETSAPQLPATERERPPRTKALSLSEYLQQRARGAL